LEAINCYLYVRLKSEYEWLTSDISVRETIESNETLFTADGMSADHLRAFAQDNSERLIS
jgi:hypothetical protein